MRRSVLRPGEPVDPELVSRCGGQLFVEARGLDRLLGKERISDRRRRQSDEDCRHQQTPAHWLLLVKGEPSLLLYETFVTSAAPRAHRAPSARRELSTRPPYGPPDGAHAPGSQRRAPWRPPRPRRV